MRFKEFREEVRALVAKAAKEGGYESIPIEVGPPPNPGYGDLASPMALRIARSSGQKPGEVAIRLASEIQDSLPTTRYVGSVSSHPGGYLNFGIKYPAFVVDAVADAASPESAPVRSGSKKRVVVEHTNVNPNKALHVGHARNLVLGDSLVRVMRHVGSEVQALNYIDDSGAQVADIVVGFKFLGISDQPPEGVKFDVYCGDSVYSRVTREYSTDPALKEKQGFVLREIEKGTGEVADYTRGIVSRILLEQLKTCWRMGAQYDLLNWESQIVHSGMWDRIFKRLQASGFVKLETEGENKGCWVIEDPDTGEQKVVVRSDGTAVYVAKDIPYAAWKLGIVDDPFSYELYTEGGESNVRPLHSTTLSTRKSEVTFGRADLAVSVIDTRQSYLQRIVAKVLDHLQAGSSTRYLHRGYEVVALSKRTANQLGFEIDSEFVHMSGRKGLYVNVDVVLAALKTRAIAETKKRNLSESESWVSEVAEALSVAALRYDLLKQDPDKMIVFDIDDSLRFEGDTGPYLCYTYARARRILSKTTGSPAITVASASRLVKDQEKALVKKMAMLDLSLDATVEYLSPREVAKFAHELAVAFNDFYEHVPVNMEDDPTIRDARLAVVDSGSRTLALAMDLIGVPHPERI